jgi:hypothetical protein
LPLVSALPFGASGRRCGWPRKRPSTHVRRAASQQNAACGAATCWCFALPLVLPMTADASDARCYCAAYLKCAIRSQCSDVCMARVPREHR